MFKGLGLQVLRVIWPIDNEIMGSLTKTYVSELEEEESGLRT